MNEDQAPLSSAVPLAVSYIVNYIYNTFVSWTVSDLGLATDVTALSSDTFARPTFPPGARQVHGVRGGAAAATPPSAAAAAVLAKSGEVAAATGLRSADAADAAAAPLLLGRGAFTTKAVFPG